jgi:phage baseplate assembly protein W
MGKVFYKGFSSHAFEEKGSFSTINIETVKRDLYNHIFTEKGERLMMPNFGTRIPSLVFEPNDERTREIVRTDLLEVFNYDPRVKLIDLHVSSLPDNNAIVAFADLLYIEFDVRETLRIEVPTA